jgi:hypothetical protein
MSTNISAMGFFEVGDKTSLICADTETTQFVKESLRDLGFKYQIAETPETAVDRIRYTGFDCIVIQETFGGFTLESNPVLDYFRPLPMLTRRDVFACLIGPSMKTLDAMQAFSQSVHLAVHPLDLPNLTAILKKALGEFEMLYRCYRDAENLVRDSAASNGPG